MIKRINSRRKELKMTQEDVAKLCGITRKQYFSLEKTGRCSLEHFIKVCKVLKLRLIISDDENIEDLFISSPIIIKEIKIDKPEVKLTWRDRLKQ